jgi:uncharacterized membrane protein
MTLGAALAVTVSLGCVVAPAAQAQTAYSLTVLKPAATQFQSRLSDLHAWYIDPANRVTSTANWVTSYTLTYLGGIKPLFNDYPARWAAGTGASVSPTKLYTTQWDALAAASPNGQLLLLNFTRQLYDTTSRKATPITYNSGGLSAVNNSGLVTLTLLADSSLTSPFAPRQVPATWRSGGVVTALPVGAAGGGIALAVNASGLVAGSVLDAVTSVPHGALWSGGTLQALPDAPGAASMLIALNDLGQSLVVRSTASCPQPGVVACSFGPRRLALRFADGTEQPINPLDGHSMARAVLNGKGVVAGRLQLTPAQGEGVSFPGLDRGYNPVDGRAFIWVNGVTQDLGTYLAGKGVKLPTGARLVDVVAINDQGSMVAEMVAADQSTSFVRLTAR